MLQRLNIQNFKGWEDTGIVRLAPLTLFFGANSSGKSSIGQFLMMLKQTAESPDRKTTLYPGDSASPAQLGSYPEMVFRRDPNRTIGFSYAWSLPRPLEVSDPLSQKQYHGDTVSFRAVVGLDEEQRAPVLREFEYELLAATDTCLTVSMQRRPSGDYEVRSTGYDLKRKKGRAWSLGAPVRFYGFQDEVGVYYQNADFVRALELEHENLLRSLCYLGPMRTGAARLYTWPGNEPDSVGYTGENTIAAILAARNRGRRISLGNRKTAKSFEEVIALKLKEMGLIEAFKVNAVAKSRQFYEVKVRIGAQREWVDLPDVGFGIAQVLPVLTQCFYAPAHAIVLMEQPEIHLHPRAQAALADVMIDVVNSRENGVDRNVQLIIETHSEHFLRRLQRRIAEDRNGRVAGKVAAYFADSAHNPAKLEALQLDQYGNIRNWPENFFGDEMDDIIAQTQAAGLKKKAERKMTEDEQ